VRVAIVNQFSNPGGGTRFLRALLPALASAYPEDHFTLFTDPTGIDRDDHAGRVEGLRNVDVVQLPQAPVRPPSRLRARLKRVRVIARVYFWVRQFLPHREIVPSVELPEQVLRQLEAYDVVYLPWPYFLCPADIQTPVVLTMHDFNFKHPFGNFGQEHLRVLEEETPWWLNKASEIVVSTRFIGRELQRFYPDAKGHVTVVPLTHFTDSSMGAVLGDPLCEMLPRDYVVCPSNTSAHKNLGALLAAFGILKRQGFALPLVVFGQGTEILRSGPVERLDASQPLYYHLVLPELLRKEGLTPGRDVIGLGYVSDAAADAIIRGARLLVAPSLYEAGSGPAVDAWHSGVPVAFSRIEPFVEQLELLGTEAWLFDPKEPASIAQAIESATGSADVSTNMSERSRVALSRYTWADIARQYREVFGSASERVGSAPQGTLSAASTQRDGS